jgi:PTH1 family peptidyl-tRNA hydrolase
MAKNRWSMLDSLLGRRRQASKLVVGLGNPGGQYERTRHNVGFWCLDRLACDSSISISKRHRLVVLGEGEIGGHSVALAKPRTFVNESGRAVVSLMARYRASVDDLLVVYDDMDLSPSKIRLRPQGGPGGHNGMKSIIEALGTQNFARLRIGIGRPAPEDDDVGHVLGAMPSDDREMVDQAIDRAAQAVVCLLAEGVDEAMSRFN